jgi:2-polyprenyl-3-methyl-5-hydroxy-6-metoxy-1,4-benzoquinol methylase
MKYTSTAQQWSEPIAQAPISFKTIASVKRSPQWAFIESKIRDHYGLIDGLRTCEIGAGQGKMSAIMALLGAQVTVLDYSAGALEKSRELFTYIGARAEFVQCDALRMPLEHCNAYDISFSLGAAEHFVGKERGDFIRAHSRVLKPGGWSFIVVPNRKCFPYRFGLELQKLAGLWTILEVPFSKKELHAIAGEAGFSDIAISGFNFREGTRVIQVGNSVKHMLLKTEFGKWLRKLKGDRPINDELRIQCIDQSKEVEYRDQILRPITMWFASPWDDVFGYALIMHGHRTK